ncbi:MAG: Ldh family oxidoreductase [Planctomycetota bacterium]|nr:Ldh family oxidoreductase [Planctomycetota bacterium]
MNNHTAEFLLELSTDLVEAMGSRREDAHIVAHHLVEAQLAGHDSHGIIRLPQYYAHACEGKVDPRAEIEVVRESPTTALLDGHYTWGQVTAMRAVELGISKARENGIAALSLRNCYHVGRVGVYPLAAAEQGFIAQVHCNGHGVCRVAPWGGTEPRLATNPVAIAIPTRGEPLLVDITTSVVAEGKVRISKNAGKEIPDGWVLDAGGKPTTNPADLYEGGSLLPLGGREGHKGYGLSIIVDLLGGALSGAGCGKMTEKVGNGLFIQLTDPACFCDPEEFLDQVERFSEYLRSSPLKEGVVEILLPGEPEQRTAARRRQEGIDIDDGTWSQVLELAGELDVEVKEAG